METRPTDEIDLLELLAKVVLTIKSNILSFIVAFILGTGLGLCYYQFVPKTYESKMMVISDILPNAFCEPLSETLNSLIIDGNHQLLADKLGLTPEEASQIGKIQIEAIKSEKDKKDVKEGFTFVITVKVDNNNLLPKLQEGVLNYLRNNEYIKVKSRQNKIMDQALIDKMVIEINSLDSLKKNLLLGHPVSRSTPQTILMDPASISSEIVKLSNEKYELINKLELVNSIQLVEGFTAYENPASPKLSLSVAAGSSLGIFFVIALIVFKSIRKMIRLSEEKLGAA